jgi:hypothetical protein
LARIELAAGELSFERTSHVDCPDIIRMQAPEANPLMELTRQVGILGQLDTPTALLSHLSPIDAVQGWRREPLPQAGKDWDVKQFILERKAMKWQAVTLQAANAPSAQGLFRFTRFQTPQYFLREGSETMRVPGPVGKYRILSQGRWRALRYDRRTKCLTVPAILRPPLLTERALILCSGYPPALSMSYKRRTLTYRDVPEEVAGITAEVLRQDLR